MQVQCHKFLQQLGVQAQDDLAAYHNCPLHPALPERTLRVYIHPVTKAYHFSCIHSKCHFEGDAVELLARVRGISIKDAVLAFAETPLSTCLDDTLLDTQVQDYLDHRQGQAQIREYLKRCNDAVFSGTPGSVLRRTLGQAKISKEIGHLPRELCSVDPIDPPQPLAAFGKKIYHKGRYLMYPYTFEGQITQINTQKIDTSGELGPVDQFPLNDSGLGIFPVAALDTHEDRLLLCESAIAACRFIKEWNLGPSGIPPILHALGFPLPRQCAGKELCLLDTAEYPLSLEYAIRAFAAKECVLGQTDSKLKVLTRQPPVTSSGIRSNCTSSNKIRSILIWLARKLITLMKDDQLDIVMKAIQVVKLTEDKQQQLVQALQRERAPASLVQLLTDKYVLGQGELRLANNMCIMRRIDGFYTSGTRGAETRLSNVLIRVDSRILTAKNELIYDCSFKHRDVGVVRGQLTAADVSTAAKLQQAITAAYVNANVDRAVYIACYDGGKNYRWPDILAKLSEGVNTYREVSHLGIDDNLHIQLPNFAVDLTQHVVQPQERIFTLNSDVVNCYSGLVYNNDNAQALDVTRTLLENCDDMYVAAFMAGVCQVIYTLYNQYHSKLKTHGRPAPRTHLCYAEPVDGVWGGTFEHLGLLFSDSAVLPHIETNAREHLSHMQELGTLPYIAYLPPWPVKRLPTLFHDSPVNLITRLDGSAATLLSEEVTTSFIVPSDYRAAAPNAVHPHDIYALQRNLPGLLRYLFKQPMPISLAHELRKPTRPAHSTYLHLCSMLDVEPADMMNDLIEEYYTASDIGVVQAFCAGLNKILYKEAALQEDNRLGIDIVEKNPSKEDLMSKNPPLIFIARQGVLVHKRIVDVVKRVTRNYAMRVNKLERELNEDKYLIPYPFGIDIDVNSYWTFDRDMWDRYVKQERWTLTKPLDSGETIHLHKLTA